MKLLATLACALFLVACETPTLEEANAASHNLALKRVDRACGELVKAIPEARKRIEAVPVGDRSVEETFQLQSDRSRAEQLCGPDADPINLVEINAITKRVTAIDGKVDQ